MDDLFLDTSIFMYAAGKPHEYKLPCIDILNMVNDRTHDFVIDTEVIQEILYRYHHIGLPESALELAWNVLDLVPVILPVSTEDVKLTLFYYKKYREYNLPPRDCIHLAVMVNNGLKDIVTADRHFDHVEEVNRIDPGDLA